MRVRWTEALHDAAKGNMFCFVNGGNEQEMHRAMVSDFVRHTELLLKQKELLNVAIATGTTLEGFSLLLKCENIPFDRINLWVVDEYAGLACFDARSCSADLFDLLGKRINDFHCLKVFSVNDYMNDMERFHHELLSDGLDICVLGVGTDGHVGFCYPPIKQLPQKFYQLVQLSDERKNEHVLKGWFPSVEDVPDDVITLSLWGIMRASIIMIGAMQEKKKDAIEQMYRQTVPAFNCPVLYLEKHEHITVYTG